MATSTSNNSILPSVTSDSNTSKKLYFKQSATEALHSAILLKARNPTLLNESTNHSQMNQTQNIKLNTVTTSNLNNNNNTETKIPLILPFANNLSTSMQTTTTTLNSEPIKCPKLLLNSNASVNVANNNNNNSIDNSLILIESTLPSNTDLSMINQLSQPLVQQDELDSPLKIKENIQLSLRSLKPAFMGLMDPLRSSTSDEDDDTTSQMDSTCSSSSSSNNNSNEIIIIQNNTKINLPQTQQRNIYLSSLNMKTTKLPNFNTKTTIITKPKMTTNNLVTPTIRNINNTNNNNNISLNNNKRAKEEALSNSSSSDEENDPTSNQMNKTNILTPILPQSIKSTATTKPQITPVVPSSNSSILAALNDSSSSFSAEIIASPLSFKSQKSSIDSDYLSMDSSSSKCSSCPSSASIISVASPTSSFTTNESNIDLLQDVDENSSGSSEPSYSRQPGFELHAHSILTNDVNSTSTPKKIKSISNLNLSKTNDSSNSKKTQKMNDIKSLLSNKSIKNITSNNNNNNTNGGKSKKKFCSMKNNQTETIMINNVNNNNNQELIMQNEQLNNTDDSIKLRPISNKAKRDPLPMRLRALPLSFWQQPNQPNVSPGTMYLPPLFKNEIDSVDDNGKFNEFFLILKTNFNYYFLNLSSKYR
jgi:hypothetical protein